MKIIDFLPLFICVGIFLTIFGDSLSADENPEKTRLNLPIPIEDEAFYEGGNPDPQKVELGKLLFFDKILSGNNNISCGTCHHVLTATGDGLSLPVGEGGQGLGVTRNTGTDDNAIVERVPRNSPFLFNLGAKEFINMFHDGRVEVNNESSNGFNTPAGNKLPLNLENVLAAQAMFPVTSATEMAGQEGENDQADLAASGDLEGVWDFIAEKLRNIPEYVEMFQEVFEITQDDISFAHVANAIAAFESVAWRANSSPFDFFLRGDKTALSRKAKRGMKLFFNDANCVSCHSGVFQTDHDFHAIAMPQIGPGKGSGSDGHEDFGREMVTADQNDRYKFRTPSLRNVYLTGPWGHDGAFNTLEGVVRHHLNAVNSLNEYDTSQTVLPSREDLDDIDFITHNNTVRESIASANELTPVELSDSEIEDLLFFLQSLTDMNSLDLRNDFPTKVPSGLPVFEF